MPAPRIAATHDLSCFGRCSLTIALPVLSAMGCQCCPLPTALLSAHTGISGFTFLDTTDEMRRISAHWSQLSLHFQAIYTGFLGSAPQINLVEDFLRRFHAVQNLYARAAPGSSGAGGAGRCHHAKSHRGRYFTGHSLP